MRDPASRGDEQRFRRRIERTGCSAFRVVVTGVAEDASIQADFARQAEGVDLPVEYEPALRYPQVPADVPPVAAR